ncbi:C-X-C chemokine receptor type 1%2C partial [Scomber scombrus]|uniref:C-X-C chemokine receptor type 2 n=1 Tax=Scomber scombrus TaxID=13677 RepID=A0AAV1NW41_SCOSC
MKLQLFIVSVLHYLVLTNQEDEKTQALESYDFDSDFDVDYFRSIFNSSLPMDDNSSASPCSVIVPGLSSLGLMITYIIVFVFSMVGNSVVVYVVVYMKKGRASTDVYLMHLAMADLLFCLTLPFWAVNVHSGWVFGNFLCKLLSGFQEAAVYSGVFLLACISVDRYFAIVRATRVFSSHQLMVNMVCGIVWLVAGILALPVAIQRESIMAEDLGQTICYENLTGESSDHWRVGLRVLRHTMGFFLPLLVMVICYGWVVVTLFHTRNLQKHKAMRVIMAVVLGFVLCWLPYNISILIDTLIRGGSIEVNTCGTHNRVQAALNVSQVLAFMHCAVNPLLYAFIGVKFRNQLLFALYKHGVISKRLRMAHTRGSVNSIASLRSRNTSVTM